MNNMTMLELLEKTSNTVKNYWEKKNDSFILKDSEKIPYGDMILELMAKAVFNNETEEHTQESIASRIGLTPPTFSKFKTGSTNINEENLKKIVNAILIRISKEENLADDKMKEQVGNLLFCILKRKEVKEMIQQFKVLPENNEDDTAKKQSLALSHESWVNKIFGNPEGIQSLKAYEDYENYFIDGGITEDEIESYIECDILFRDYMLEDNSKIHVVIFDVKGIDRGYLHQRIRCLQRKDNVYAVLMVEKGVCYDSIDFYQDEHSNIMLLEYKEIWEENSEVCSYDYLRGICCSWYDEKCKAFMTERINKIFVSHK